MDWARTVLEQVGFRPVALPLAFILELASAVASACCTLPLLGAIVGYSGTREDRDRHKNHRWSPAYYRWFLFAGNFLMWMETIRKSGE